MLLAAESKMKKDCDNLSAICLRWQDGVTSSPSLQPVSHKEASQQLMWDDAWIKNAENRLQRRKPNPGSKSGSNQKESLEATIEELEEYVRQFEPKPRTP